MLKRGLAAVLIALLLAMPRTALSMSRPLRITIGISLGVIVAAVLLGGTTYFIYGSIHPDVSGFGSGDASREGYMRGAAIFVSGDLECIADVIHRETQNHWALVDIHSKDADIAIVAPKPLSKGSGIGADVVTVRF
jgi:hypothetical protein